jgi:hypothetical protein
MNSDRLARINHPYAPPLVGPTCHKDECACIVSDFDVLCNSEKIQMQVLSWA